MGAEVSTNLRRHTPVKTFFRSIALVIATMMCLLLCSFASAAETVEIDFAQENGIHITGYLVDKNANITKDGALIAEWEAAARTLTIKGPLNLTVPDTFAWFDPAAFPTKNATIMIEDHVNIVSEGHAVFEAWQGEFNGFELTVTSKGYNAENPSASTSSLTLKTSGEREGGANIHACRLKLKDLYIPNLTAKDYGFLAQKVIIENTTLSRGHSALELITTFADSPASDAEIQILNSNLSNIIIDFNENPWCPVIGSQGEVLIKNSSIQDFHTVGMGIASQSNITIDNSKLSMGAISEVIDCIGTITIRDSQLEEFEAERYAIVAQKGVILENSTLTGFETNLALIAALDEAGSGIQILNSEVTDVVTNNANCAIESPAEVLISSSTIDGLRSSTIGIGSQKKLSITNHSKLTNLEANVGLDSGNSIIISDSEISDLTAWWYGIVAQDAVTVENSKLINTNTENSVIATLADSSSGIRIVDSELSSIIAETTEVFQCAISSPGEVLISGSTIDGLKSNTIGIGSQTKLSIVNSQLSNLEASEVLDSPASIIISDSEINKLTADRYGIVAQQSITVEKSKLNNTTTGLELLCTLAADGTGISIQNSELTNADVTGESGVVSSNSDVLISGSSITDLASVQSCILAEGDMTINNSTLTATCTSSGVPGICTKTGTFTLNGVVGPAPEASNVNITPNSVFPTPTPTPEPTATPEPAPTPTVKVEVEDQTEEQKQNNTVTVFVPDTTIEEVIASTTNNVVELPVEHAPVDQQTAVTTAKVSEEAFEKLADTNKAVSVPLDHAEVIIQPSVVEQIAEKAAAGSEIEICVEQKKPQEVLNTAQMQSLADQKVAVVITADVFMKQGDTRTKIDFQADKDDPVTLKVPFTPPAGESGHDYVIVYVADNGQAETLTTYYTNGHLVFETYHFSDFVITTRTVDTNVSTSVPQTGDNTPIALLTMLMLVSLVLIIRNRKLAA